MVYWIKKTAFLLGISAFFGILFISMFSSNDPLDIGNILCSIIKGLLGGGLLWFAGFILGDIIFKGILTDVPIDKDNLVEGGLIQRINEKQKMALPGGPDMPLIDAKSGNTVGKINPVKKNKKSGSRGV